MCIKFKVFVRVHFVYSMFIATHNASEYGAALYRTNSHANVASVVTPEAMRFR